MTSPPSRREDACDLLILGAGAAGLMAAITAREAGGRVVVLEAQPEAGRKLCAAGGGRGNLAAAGSLEDRLAAYGRSGPFARDALRAFDTPALADFFSALGEPLKVEEERFYFPVGGSALRVRDALFRRALAAGVHFVFVARVTALRFASGAVAGAEAQGREYAARRVLLATGGWGYRGLGATEDGWTLARQAGHAPAPARPALVPLILGNPGVADLAGLSLSHVRLALATSRRVDRSAFQGDLLFTHRGLSGPAALNLSGTVAEQLADTKGPVDLRLEIEPGATEADWQARIEAWRREGGKKRLATHLARHMPARLADYFARRSGADPAEAAAHLPRDPARQLASHLAGLPLTVTSTEGFDRAMVTRGGVRLREVRPATMESRLVSGLYFAGEVLDLDGPCGGYNLHWAFASGRLAAQSAVL